jgi:hypothetical protein
MIPLDQFLCVLVFDQVVNYRGHAMRQQGFDGRVGSAQVVNEILSYASDMRTVRGQET